MHFLRAGDKHTDIHVHKPDVAILIQQATIRSCEGLFVARKSILMNAERT